MIFGIPPPFNSVIKVTIVIQWKHIFYNIDLVFSTKYIYSLTEKYKIIKLDRFVFSFIKMIITENNLIYSILSQLVVFKSQNNGDLFHS